MESLRQLNQVAMLLLHHAYTADDSDHEAWHTIPGKRGGERPSEIEVKNQEVHRLLGFFEKELEYISTDYLSRLERVLRGVTRGYAEDHKNA